MYYHRCNVNRNYNGHDDESIHGVFWTTVWERNYIWKPANYRNYVLNLKKTYVLIKILTCDQQINVILYKKKKTLSSLKEEFNLYLIKDLQSYEIVGLKLFSTNIESIANDSKISKTCKTKKNVYFR